MNIAIVIAVSNYGNLSCNLPGCLGDAQLIKNLLEATNKYNEFLFLYQDTKSSYIKEQLITFVENIKNVRIQVVH
jgi:hypothetical protein